MLDRAIVQGEKTSCRWCNSEFKTRLQVVNHVKKSFKCQHWVIEIKANGWFKGHPYVYVSYEGFGKKYNEWIPKQNVH